MKVVEFYWNENPEEIGLVDKFNTMVQVSKHYSISTLIINIYVNNIKTRDSES